MIKKVLFATDYSEASLNALETAICIALKNKALLLLLHVVESENTNPTGLPVKDQAWQVAEAIAAGIQQKHKIKTDIIFREGYAGPAIVRTAIGANADLIIMGKHGASGKRELFVGSTAYYTLKNAACPVLVIPEGEKWTSFGQLLFPLRTSEGLLKIYKFIKALNIASDARLEILTFSTEQNFINLEVPAMAGKNMNGYTNSNSMEVSVSLSHEKNIAREVLEKADYFAVGLIVLSQAVDAINKQSYIGPFCQQVIHHTQVPVLYLR